MHLYILKNNFLIYFWFSFKYEQGKKRTLTSDLRCSKDFILNTLLKISKNFVIN